jgi:RNA polymerase sigma-70 factor (ECF subfamily)
VGESLQTQFKPARIKPEKRWEPEKMESSENTSQIFEEYRALLFAIAYRMLSSATDAEDMVQEAFVRWLQADEKTVQSPRAYLSTIITNLCLDQLRSAKTQREVYVGPWLPEPIFTDQRLEPTATAELAESLSFAFLTMLESLNPLERAIFVLREAFDYDYDEIGPIVGKSSANCRQVLHRAHQHLGQQRPRFNTTREQQERITSQFIRASTEGDIPGLLSLLTDDIVFTPDGGGKVRAGLKPLYGPDKVSRGLLGFLTKQPWNWQTIQVRLLEVNGQLALVLIDQDRVVCVTVYDIVDTKISRIYCILNPDKLQKLTSALKAEENG